MKIDMNKLVALVKGTKGLLTDKQAVSQVTVIGLCDPGGFPGSGIPEGAAA